MPTLSPTVRTTPEPLTQPTTADTSLAGTVDNALAYMRQQTGQLTLATVLSVQALTAQDSPLDNPTTQDSIETVLDAPMNYKMKGYLKNLQSTTHSASMQRHYLGYIADAVSRDPSLTPYLELGLFYYFEANYKQVTEASRWDLTLAGIAQYMFWVIDNYPDTYQGSPRAQAMARSTFEAIYERLQGNTDFNPAEEDRIKAFLGY